jgi:cell division protein FtsB
VNVYPIIEAQERRRFLDWRFLAALTALVLVAFVVWAGVRNYDIREAEAAQKNALIEQLSDRATQIESLEADIADLTDRIAVLQDRARTDRKLATAERKSAARERAKLIRQQERMLQLLQAQGVDFRTSRTVSYVRPVFTEVAGTQASRPPTTRPSKATPPPRRTAAAPTAGKSGKTPSGKAQGIHKN